MTKILQFFMAIGSLIVPITSQAHEQVEMATGLRSDGKIYVVIAVIAIIFIALTVYLYMMDKRLNKLEKENQ